jgi:hypothetical protein
MIRMLPLLLPRGRKNRHFFWARPSNFAIMETVLTNADVRSIWSKPLTVTVRTVEQQAGEYSVVTLTDGAVHAVALVRGVVVAGRELTLTRHRVQWINGTRYWLVMAWDEVGSGSVHGTTREMTAAAPAPPLPASPAPHPFCL